MKSHLYRYPRLAFVFLLVAAGCTTPAVRREPAPAKPVQTETPPEEAITLPQKVSVPYPDRDVADVTTIPQRLDELAKAAGDGLAIGRQCGDSLLKEFRARYFAPWTAKRTTYDRTETVNFMKHTAGRTWYGENLRRVDPKLLQEILDSCALESYPSRFQLAVAVAPGHLRGLPTALPLFDSRDGYPFDMLAYPQLKLNEPLRVVHATRDGVWLFVETPYTNGWIEARNVALVDQEFVDNWMALPLAVLVRDQVALADGLEVRFRAKLGTLFPVVQESPDTLEVGVATAGDEGKGRNAVVRIGRRDAQPFPVPFDVDNVTLVGNSMLGQPYGWGELYGLRDCSALLRDFFIPFGIWLPRTSADQIASVPGVVSLAGQASEQKVESIKREGKPFLSILHKNGHVVLYVGTDAQGRPLVMHDAWSVAVKQGEGRREEIIGKVVITTSEPGKELGLVEGSSLLERFTSLGTITERCKSKR